MRVSLFSFVTHCLQVGHSARNRVVPWETDTTAPLRAAVGVAGFDTPAIAPPILNRAPGYNFMRTRISFRTQGQPR